MAGATGIGWTCNPNIFKFVIDLQQGFTFKIQRGKILYFSLFGEGPADPPPRPLPSLNAI